MAYRDEYYIGAGFRPREWEATPDDPVETHRHNEDHVTLIMKGAVRVFEWRAAVNEEGKELVGDNGKPILVSVPLGEKEYLVAGERHRWGILIPKDTFHRFEALTPLVFGLCWFSCVDPLTHQPVPYYNGYDGAFR